MSRHSHQRTEKKIRKLFAEGLDGQTTSALWASLYECPSCAKKYEQYISLENALVNSLTVPSMFSIERVRRTVFQNQQKTHSMPYWRSFRFRWIAGMVCILVAATFLWLTVNRKTTNDKIAVSHHDTDAYREIAIRGASRTAASYVGIRVFSVDAQNGGINEPRGLYFDDVISFTYTWARPTPGYLILFGLQEETDYPLWYYPDYGGDQSIGIKPDKVDEPLNDGIVLRENHHVGKLRIVSLFSTKPIPVNEVRSAVVKLQESGDLLDVNVTIPIDNPNIGVIQYSFLLNIEDSHAVDRTN